MNVELGYNFQCLLMAFAYRNKDLIISTPLRICRSAGNVAIVI
jgi:hypothetical protein